MFPSTSFIVPLVLVASAVARPTDMLVRRATSDVRLSDWASHEPALESYWTFKNRFRALGCASQQGTDFYTSCCYPLDATQSLSDRPAECTPASSSCSASVQAVTPSSSSSSAAPAYTDPNAGSNNNNNNNNNDNGYVDDDENLPVCEDPNDDGEWHDDDYDAYTYSPPSSSSEPAATSPPSSYTPDPTSTETPQSTPDNNSGNTGSTDNSGNNNNNNNGGSGNTGGGNTGETYSNGWATFFYQGGNPGACGNYHSDNDLIAALDSRMYGYDYSHPSSWCGRTVRVTNTQNGKTVDVMIQDACPTCVTSTSLDLSHGAFLAIADESQGTVPITWTPLY